MKISDSSPRHRQALRMVREALGEDAVILSNKTVDGGVELTAAIDLVDNISTDTVDQRIPSQSRCRARVNRTGDAAGRRQQDDALEDMRRNAQPAALDAGRTQRYELVRPRSARTAFATTAQSTDGARCRRTGTPP